MNAEKFSSTVIPLYRELFAVAFTLLKDRDTAADIVQDAMVKLWNYRDMLDNVASVKGFALVTLRTRPSTTAAASDRATASTT